MNVPGGAMVAMNNTAAAINQTANRQQADQDQERRLNTYIFDYLCNKNLYDLARNFSLQCPINPTSSKPRHQGVNGVDDSMDTDSKEDVKRPTDLPFPNIPHHPSENAFLYDWWVQFWDIFGAARRGGNPNPNAESYLQHNMGQTKMRQLQQQRMLSQTTDQNLMRQQQMYSGMGMQPNGVNMAKQAMQNNRTGAPNLMQAKMMQNNMQRDGSIGDNRPQSPSAMGNAPSPSKRPRTDDGNFNPGPAGRGQPMQGNQMGNIAGGGGPNGGMMLQNGLSNDISQPQMNAFPQNANGQQKSLEAITAAGGPGPLGQNNLESFPLDQQRLPNGGSGGAQGNHALQDYQMQLMLLEQQNKKRLLMARQEQDNINHVPGGPGTQSGGPITFTPNMSPSGSRAGPSPNPNDQMRKIAGTPKLGQGGILGSPAMQADLQNRGSPVPGYNHEMQTGMRQQMFNNQQGMMGQAPSSHPSFNMAMGNMTPQGMEQLRIANGNRMPNGQQWPQGTPQQQMMQQGPGQQGQQVGTPQQRSMTMPPPPAPGNNQEQQRTQPSSPAPQVAPPTPSQTTKTAPKGKKEGGTKKKAAAKKGGAAAATPASENNEPPATPTPSTPITPHAPASFHQKNAQGNVQQPQPPAQAAQSAGPMDTSSAPFADLGQDNGNFDLDFTVGGSDVLENFDFDSFLHNTDDNSGFGNFDLMNFDVNPTETPAGS